MVQAGSIIASHTSGSVNGQWGENMNRRKPIKIVLGDFSNRKCAGAGDQGAEGKGVKNYFSSDGEYMWL